MQIAGSVALVTGANRGLGRKFAQALLERGAAKVYAAARNPDTIDIPGVTPLALDITDPTSVAAAAAIAGDVTLLVNNAGSSTQATLSDGDLADIRLEMETHYFGTLATTQAFAPILAANGGGAILNVLSVLSWLSTPPTSAYAAAKSAEWSLTNSFRQILAPAGTVVTALHVGYMDTDMAAHVDGPKEDPATVAGLALDGVEAGEFEVVADEKSRQVKSALSGPVTGIYSWLAPVAAH
jgi:NAD(P)-dependent dehydrogenase (short-subunit alcohol dehydrogenase family)